MKKCPMCAEDIQDDAIVCKHCGCNIQLAHKKICMDEFIKVISSKTNNKYSIKYFDENTGKVILENDKETSFSFFIFFILLLIMVLPGILYAFFGGSKLKTTIIFDDGGKPVKVFGNNLIKKIAEEYK